MSTLAFLALLASADLRPLSDAPIHAIHFVDTREGWAAGADGVIWHTINGGKTWERQPTGTRANLRSIQFLTPYTGFAVGREDQPSGRESAGVILVTNDGGLKWSRINDRSLPGLQFVRFFDEVTGIVAGDGTDSSPGGVFVTKDGGASWYPVPGGRSTSWTTGDFVNPQTGILGGVWGRLATVRDGIFSPADVEKLAGRNIQAVKVSGARAVAVGQGGLVLISQDSAGERWGFADLKLPLEIAAQCDFRGVAMVGSKIWIAGRPGSVIFHSPDFGQSWQTQPTGQPLPMHAVQFINEQVGWATGDLGTIIGTTDGGKTWTTQRSGGQRAAALFLHSRNAEIPLEMVAYLGADEGYLVSSVRIAMPDPATSSPSRVTEGYRWSAAIRRAGGASGECLSSFPMAQHQEAVSREELQESWGPAVGGNARDQLVRQLALQIRSWQPEIVVTDFAGAPLESMVVEAVKLASEQASAPDAFEEHSKVFHLEPWAVKKVYTAWDGPGVAPVNFNAAEPRRRLNDSARDFAAPAFRLLNSSQGETPDRRSFRLLASRLPDAARHSDLMTGITLAYSGTARRAAPAEDIDPERVAEAEKIARERRNLSAISQTDLGKLADPSALVAQIAPSLDKLPADQGANAALRVAQGYVRAGQWTLAREAYALVVERYPSHPAATDALRWLVAFHASSEARHRDEKGQFVSLRKTDIRQASTAPSRDDPAKFGSGAKLENRPLTENGTEESRQAFSNPAIARRWYEAAKAFEPKLATMGGTLANDPTMQFCLQSVHRQLGDVEASASWYRKYVASQPLGAVGTTGNPFRDAAAGELWLLERTGTPPRPLATCRRTESRPRLDGKIDDECWNGLAPLVLRDPTGATQSGYATKCWMAYDAEYLYVALDCKHPQDRFVAPVAKRQRDSEIKQFDRVSILLDLDRDYTTYYRLSIDQRGAVAEDCWGDPTWNPKWLVAHVSNPEGWTAELAIPLAELTGDPVPLGKAWAMNVIRVLPGRGVQSWSQPADVEPRPEGLGLMLFVEGEKSPSK